MMLVRIDRATDEKIQILIMKINQESICICTRAVFSFSIYQRQKNKRFSFINFRYRLLNPNFHENIAWIQSFFPNMFLTSVRISWRPALPSLLEVGSLSMSEPAFIFPSDRSSFTTVSAESVNISFTQRKAFTYDSPATFYQKSWKSPLFQSIHL